MAGQLGPKQFSLAALLMLTTVTALVCGVVKAAGAAGTAIGGLLLLCGLSWLLILVVVVSWYWRE